MFTSQLVFKVTLEWYVWGTVALIFILILGNKDHAIAVQGDPSFSISCHVKFDPVGTHSQVTWLYNNVPINFGRRFLLL